jgi:DNA-binding response OmpR family regulator
MRRYNRSSSLLSESNKLTYKDISIDTETFSVQVGDTSVSFTKREFLILELLMKYPKKVFTKSNLYEHVWNDEFFGDENTINVHISNIRIKLAKANPSEDYIQTVWGIGFMMSE